MLLTKQRQLLGGQHGHQQVSHDHSRLLMLCIKDPGAIWLLVYETAHLINPYLRSYLHRKRLLSTDAHALLISGNTPQKHMVWQVRYLSRTMAGRSGEVGDTARRREGHCIGATAQHHTTQHRGG